MGQLTTAEDTDDDAGPGAASSQAPGAGMAAGAIADADTAFGASVFKWTDAPAGDVSGEDGCGEVLRTPGGDGWAAGGDQPGIFGTAASAVAGAPACSGLGHTPDGARGMSSTSEDARAGTSTAPGGGHAPDGERGSSTVPGGGQTPDGERGRLSNGDGLRTCSAWATAAGAGHVPEGERSIAPASSRGGHSTPPDGGHAPEPA